MATVKRVRDPSLGEVVVKESGEPAGRARLAREAAVLERARHPGVVQLVRYDDEDDRAILVTRDAGGRTVEDLSDLGGDQVAAFGAALAQTLADLHRLGVSHGAVRAEHVVVSDQGQPVLCGLGDAGLVDPPEGQWGGFDPAADVGALADVLAGMLEPAEGLRRWSGGVAGLLRRADERSMDQLAEDLAAMAGPIGPPLRLANGPGPAREPTIDLTLPTGPVCVRELSEAEPVEARDAGGAADGVPAAWLDQRQLDDHPFWADPVEPEPVRLTLGDASTVDGLFAPGRSFGPRPPRPDPVPPRRWYARRGLALAALALLAVLAGATTVATLGSSGGRGPDGRAAGDLTGLAPSSSAAVPADEPPTAPAAPAAAPDRSPADCPASHDEAALVGVSSACADRLSAVGNEITVGPLRWVVGADGDRAVAGDFDCDGWLEVASVSAEGDVALFDRWAGAGQEPVGRIVERVVGARAVTAPAQGGCHELLVERADQPPVSVSLSSGS